MSPAQRADPVLAGAGFVHHPPGGRRVAWAVVVLGLVLLVLGIVRFAAVRDWLLSDSDGGTRWVFTPGGVGFLADDGSAGWVVGLGLVLLACLVLAAAHHLRTTHGHWVDAETGSRLHASSTSTDDLPERVRAAVERDGLAGLPPAGRRGGRTDVRTYADNRAKRVHVTAWRGGGEAAVLLTLEGAEATNAALRRATGRR